LYDNSVCSVKEDECVWFVNMKILSLKK
jgi:hypothetical protein